MIPTLFLASQMLFAGLVHAGPAATHAPNAPLRVLLRAGPKTHGPGEHDHPRWASDFAVLLGERGARVTSSLVFPSADQLADCDVMVMYAADAGSIHGEERTRLEAFLARGGGLVAVHDAVCGDDPHWFKTVIGGAWEHGHSKWQVGDIDLYYADQQHPITDGCGNFRLRDELYHALHMDPDARVLVNAFPTVFDIAPQAWVLERGNHRAFVSLQGHFHESFSNLAWRGFLLRGIAWAGKHEVDSLLFPSERAALAYPPGGPTAPENAAASMELHPDFELTLVAAEPVVVNPISIDWDARGRPFVALTPGYPDKQKFSGVPARDEIAILDQRDVHGRYQARRTFAGGLDLVTSLVFWKDGVIVSSAPEILWLRDTDGDDVADARQVLFSGFGFGDTHATISNLRHGLDGWIYGTQGYSGNESRHVVGTDGVDHGAIGNGVFRFRPDASAIEMVSSYGSNTWGLDFADDGELFFTMANGSHLRQLVVPERALGRSRLPGVESWAALPDHDRVVPLVDHQHEVYKQIDFIGGFTAASGCNLYTGGAWPAPWRNAHFVCEPTVSLVHHDALEERGVIFQAIKAREAEFLASRDLWFRPVHTRVGPDGAVYVLDFYNQAAVHNDTRGPKHGPTNAAVRPDRDRRHGRIWRVQHKQATALPVPNFALGEPPAWIEGFSHDNAWVRQTALRLVLERGAASLRGELEQVARGALNPLARLTATWALAHAGALEQGLLGRLMLDPEVSVRRGAVQAAGALLARGAALDANALLVNRLADPSARVRLWALVALGQGRGAAEVCQALIDLWPELGDDWSRSALLGALTKDPQLAWEALLARGDSEPVRTLAQHLARRIATSGDVAVASRCVQAVASRPQAAPALCAALLEPLGTALTRDTLPAFSVELEQALRDLLAHPSEDVALSGLPLVLRWDKQGRLRQATRALAERLAQGLRTQEAASLEPQREEKMLRALLAVEDERAFAIERLSGWLVPSVEEARRAAAISALNSTDDLNAARALAGAWNSMAGGQRAQVFEQLLARSAWAGALLDRVSSGELLARQFSTQGLHRLHNHQDAGIAARATELLAAARPASAAAISDLVAQLLPEVDRAGDAQAGRLVFEQNCAACHIVDGRGGHIGPDLTGMGAHGAAWLLPVILDPNRTVEGAYTEWQARTKDDLLVGGILVRESSESVVLRSTAGDVEVPRAELAALENTGRSPMPTGFERLGATALRDLMQYLSGNAAGFRLLDLKSWASASTSAGLFDTRRDAKPMRFRRFGVQTIAGVPFEILDPSRTPSAKNALVLKGGLVGDWESKTKMPQSCEIALGFELASVHVLGGIAAWGWPYFQDKEPILKWTWNYSDGSSESVLLHNGVEFSDWIGRHDVPGSTFVEKLLEEDSWGQVRHFEVPCPRRASVRSITLESFDNRYAPVVLALTAQRDPAPAGSGVAASSEQAASDIVIVGGGSSHDFKRYWDEVDRATLRAAGLTSTSYVESPAELAAALQAAKVLVLANNRELPGEELRSAVFAFVERGGGLLLLHAATWYNWNDWPSYNAQLVGGGSRSHEAYGEFDVEIQAEHPVTAGVTKRFTIQDELYRFEVGPLDAMTALAVGRSRTSGAIYPVVWTHTYGKGRIVGLTLGHDGAAHQHADYQRLLVNAVRWAAAAAD